MAFKKTLAERLFKISKISNQSLSNCRISSPAVQPRIPQNTSKSNIAPDPRDNGKFRRLFHKRAISPMSNTPELLPMQIGESLAEKLRSFDIAKSRIKLDGLMPPAIKYLDESPLDKEGLTVEDARKLLRAAQLELVKTRLREIENSWIPYPDFVQICVEGCSDLEQGIRIAKTLDESGTVIVLGNVVFLKPEQENETMLFRKIISFYGDKICFTCGVVKAIGGLIPFPATRPNDPRRKELEQMEKQKAAIDKKADTLVRRELWCGLGYFVAQTAAFMRLTFWELSWDVMEPICFYVTSTYFMAGYAFFLRTSKEPCFEGFYQSRFSAKQKKLMQKHNFNMERYNELRKICYPGSATSAAISSPDKACYTN